MCVLFHGVIITIGHRLISVEMADQFGHYLIMIIII